MVHHFFSAMWVFQIPRRPQCVHANLCANTVPAIGFTASDSTSPDPCRHLLARISLSHTSGLIRLASSDRRDRPFLIVFEQLEVYIFIFIDSRHAFRLIDCDSFDWFDWIDWINWLTIWMFGLFDIAVWLLDYDWSLAISSDYCNCFSAKIESLYIAFACIAYYMHSRLIWVFN